PEGAAGQAEPSGTGRPAAEVAEHPLVRSGVFTTPEEAAAFDREAAEARTPGQKRALVDTYEFDSPAERRAMLRYLGMPETEPASGNVPGRGPRTPPAAEMPAVPERLYHVTDYKNPGHSFDAALSILDRKGAPSDLWVRDGQDPLTWAEQNLPPSGV